jgi:hypothetical protein
MSHAEMCPVCHGEGQFISTVIGPSPRTCHGCGGKGWVEVKDGGQIFPSDYFSGVEYHHDGRPLPSPFLVALQKTRDSGSIRISRESIK